MLTPTLNEENTGERKTSASSSQSKGKDRERSEGNICFAENKVFQTHIFFKILSNVVRKHHVVYSYI